jgi:hypothetical protein
MVTKQKYISTSHFSIYPFSLHAKLQRIIFLYGRNLTINETRKRKPRKKTSSIHKEEQCCRNRPVTDVEGK